MTIDHQRFANHFISNELIKHPKSAITIDDLADLVPGQPGASKEEIFRDRAWVMRELEARSLNATPFEVRHRTEDGSTAVWIIALYVRNEANLPGHLIRSYPPVTNDEIRAAIDEHDAAHAACYATGQTLYFS